MNAIAELRNVFPGVTQPGVEAAAARLGINVNADLRPTVSAMRGEQLERLLGEISLDKPNEALLAYLLSIQLTHSPVAAYAQSLCEAAYEFQLQHQRQAKTRIHKGHTLYQLSAIVTSSGDASGGFRYCALAHLEDCMSTLGQPDHKTGAAYSALRTRYGVRAPQFERLWHTVENVAGKARKNPVEELAQRYPELLYLFTWLEAGIVAPLSRTMTELPNWTLLEELLPIASADSSGKAAEVWLAAYFFGTAAFEVRTNVWTDTKEYEFDVLVASAIDHAQFATIVGAYFAGEAKNWGGTVGVSEINHFASKLMFHDLDLGVLLARNNVSGAEKVSYANARKTMLKLAQSRGVHVLVWDESIMRRFVDDRVSALVALRAGYEQARFELGGKHRQQ